MEQDSLPFTSGGVFSVTRELKKLLRADRISHLRSIDLDTHFVLSVHRARLSPPLFANLRCGVWYVPPALSAGGCYFKSTDGHDGSWSFSITRINLQVALAAASHGSVMIVDSTRTGKRFPDALAKTVPIWCCVINRALALRADAPPPTGGGASGWDERLWLPAWITAAEASLIEKRMNEWVAALHRPALAPVLQRLRQCLLKPLRPVWCCPHRDAPGGEPQWEAGRAVDRIHSTAHGNRADGRHGNGGCVPHDAPDPSPGYYAVLCVCASAVCSSEASREHRSWTYVQGAGDDEENWARGLCPEQWWRWRAHLLERSALSGSEAELELEHLQTDDAHASLQPGQSFESCDDTRTLPASVSASASPPRLPTALWDSGVCVGSAACIGLGSLWEHVDAILHVGSASSFSTVRASLGLREDHQSATNTSSASDGGAADCDTCPSSYHGELELVLASGRVLRCCHVPIEEGKRAQPSKDWWQRVVLPTCLVFARKELVETRRIFVCCDRGEDRAPAVALAVLLAFFNSDAVTRQLDGPCRALTKEEVRGRMALLQSVHADARVPRLFHKELNAFFVAPAGGWTGLRRQQAG